MAEVVAACTFRVAPAKSGGRGDPQAVSRERSEGDRPAGLVDGGDAVLPIVPDLSRQMIEAARLERYVDAAPAFALLAAEAHRPRRAERDAADLIVDRPVVVPADPGAGIVTQ